MIDGFAGPGGTPQNLIAALRDHGARDLTIISNTAGLASVIGFGTIAGDRPIDIGVLVDNEQVRKVTASFPVSPSPSRPTSFEKAYLEGKVELEVVPQGTLAERIRAGGAGIPAFYTPTGAGTLMAEGKEVRVFNGREHLLEYALKADFALLRGHRADTSGNTVYRGTSRNFNAVMATAAAVTILEVDEVVEVGDLDPEGIHTPGIFVDRVVEIP
jgi:3-oxoadipate CoA-transferase alpha subunit